MTRAEVIALIESLLMYSADLRVELMHGDAESQRIAWEKKKAAHERLIAAFDAKQEAR
jgi:hypothetical protein